MISYILIGLCFALTVVEVRAGTENEVTRGLYPYMAFIYYPDETVVDSSGNRFVRGAVLIRVNWLVSSAIGPNVLDGFPRKTLLARAGAISIDANFTLNEDEYEQEREVIQIIRPYNHSATQWWRTDISLLKTLLPFNITSSVAISTMKPKHESADKSCSILVYVKRFGNLSEEKILAQIFVELLPPSIMNCGSYYTGHTMTCAGDTDENKHDPNFCVGNSGGPLICDGEVTGLQTYIDNDCKQPHLYQLLQGWDNFISCGTEEKCQEEECIYICDIANKDAPSTIVTTIEEFKTNSEYTTTTTVTTTTEQITSTITTPEITTTLSSTTPELLRTEITETTSLKPTVTITTEIPSITTASTTTTTRETTVTEGESDTTETQSWPKHKDDDKKMEDVEQENMERNPTVEAQRHDVKVKPTGKGAAYSEAMNIHTLFFEFIIMACLI